MPEHDVRWIQRLDSFTHALAQLERAVGLASSRNLSELEQQGLIQAFEFTHELAWKTLKDFFEVKGNQGIYGSKDAVREAFKVGLIEDGETWMRMIASRNASSHTYNQKPADSIASDVVQSYAPQFRALLGKLEELANEEA